MSAQQPEQVRVAPVSAVRAVATAVGVVAVLLVMVRSRTVLHWLITAGAAAMLLDGPVRALVERRVRRGLAVLAVTLATLSGAALLTYGVVDAVVEQYGNLQESAPTAVEGLVESGVLAGLDERFDLVGRTDDLVAQAPERLLGSPASAARTAAERLGEVVLVITLTVFMLIAYERFEQRLLRLNAEGHPWRWVGIDVGVHDGAAVARHVIGRVAALGLLTAVVAQVSGVAAPAVLGLWMAWWRLLPGLGIVVGHAPLVLLLVTDTSRPVTALAIGALLVGEVLARLVDRRRPAPAVPMAFLSAVAFMAGFELGGVVGAVVVVVLVHLAVGVVERAAAPSAP
jgi:predicted PurR-regulated permease PerM